MAINPTADVPSLALTYVLGKQNAPTNICVAAGDRLYLIQMVANGDVAPDGTVGAGAGYMPHWAYRPEWPRLQDVDDPPQGATLINGLNGNAATGPTIRVDLAYLYCPWAGQVTIEGGQGLQGNGSPTEIVIAYGWDQQSRQRQGWWKIFHEAALRIMGHSRRDGPLRFPRVPMDMRGFVKMTLTFWNSAPTGSPFALPIARPQMCDSAWTPETEQLVLDSGTGTTSTTVRTNGESNRAPMGGYSRVTAGNIPNNCIICGITL